MTKSAKHKHARATKTKPTRVRTLPRMARAKKPEKPVPFIPTAPAATPPKPELTFTITEIGEAFGFMTGASSDAQNPVIFARNALDDARRTLRLAEEFLVGHIDFDPLMRVVSNAGKRAEIADMVLSRFEVRS